VCLILVVSGGEPPYHCRVPSRLINRVRNEGIFEILNGLPRRSPSAARIAADVVPPLVEWLGFDPAWLRFEYAFVYGAQRIRVLDAVLLEPETERPFLVFEVKDGGRRDRRTDAYSELQELLDATGAYAGIWITGTELGTLGRGDEISIRFGTVSPNDLERLRSVLWRDQAQWRDRALRLGRRQPPAQRGRPGKRPECEQRFQATKDALTNDEKKKSLEGLVRFLVEQVDYLRVKYADVRTASSEIDLIVENRGRSRHTMFDEYGRHFLIECKNWSQRVGAKEVRDFVGKLLKTKIRLGVLATREGVTGGGGGEDALREIHFCYDALQTAVLVLTEEDLQALCSGADLHSLLDEKLDRLRFDLP
jgi:hypothetical protein